MPQLTSQARIELRLEQHGFTGAQENHQTKDLWLPPVSKIKYFYEVGNPLRFISR